MRLTEDRVLMRIGGDLVSNVGVHLMRTRRSWVVIGLDDVLFGIACHSIPAWAWLCLLLGVGFDLGMGR